MDILVSINCMTYNHEKYIAQALDSFLMQETNFSWEIVIHDDASTDGTVAIIQEYANQYPDLIKPLFQSENQQSQGIKVNTIFNVPRSRGRYIALCDGDDYWTDPYKLQKQADYMEKHPDCSMCFNQTQLYKEDQQKTVGFIRPYKESCFVPTEDILSRKGISHISSLMYRKDCLQEPADFYLKGTMGDYFLFIFLSLKGSAYYFDEPMSAYRLNVADSWMQRLVYGSKEKRIWLNQGVLYSLNELNIYTDYKYADIIRLWQAECEQEIILAEGKLEVLLQAKYIRYSKKQFLYSAAKMYMNKYLPSLYKKLRRLRNRFR